MWNKLFTHCQPGFIPGDSCAAQLLSITHKIYKSIDCNPPTDVRGIFLEISKAVEKVWYEVSIFKLNAYGVDDILKLLENYLTGRQQRVVSNNQFSPCQNIFGRRATEVCIRALFISNLQ